MFTTTTATDTDGHTFSSHGAVPARPAQPTATVAQGSLLAALIDEFDSGVVLCAADGGVIVANRSARDELRRAQVVALADGRVRALHTPERLRAALHAAAVGGRRQLLMLGCGSARRLVYLVPMPDATAALLFGRRGVRCDLALQMLSSLFGLTACECGVLRALVDGKRPAAIAADRGVALSTVRSQVLSLRTKLGADGIADLVGIVAALPPIASALDGGGRAALH